MVKIEEVSETEASPMEALLGKELLISLDTTSKKTLPTEKTLEKKDLVLLYFSASWCPPCQSFSPVLKEFYKHASEQIEIIYISSDKTVPEFEGYFGSMPWLSLPMMGTAPIKRALAQACHISGIPALIVLDRATGHFVTDQGRTDVVKWKQSAGSSPADKAKEIVAQWKAVEAVPLAEAKFGGGGAAGGLMSIIMTIAKNPAFIFGMIYIVKYIYRYIKKYLPEAEAAIEDTAEPVPEPEF